MTIHSGEDSNLSSTDVNRASHLGTLYKTATRARYSQHCAQSPISDANHLAATVSQHNHTQQLILRALAAVLHQ